VQCPAPVRLTATDNTAISQDICWPPSYQRLVPTALLFVFSHIDGGPTFEPQISAQRIEGEHGRKKANRKSGKVLAKTILESQAVPTSERNVRLALYFVQVIFCPLLCLALEKRIWRTWVQRNNGNSIVDSLRGKGKLRFLGMEASPKLDSQRKRGVRNGGKFVPFTTAAVVPMAKMHRYLAS
jgi:hypothetical protein